MVASLLIGRSIELVIRQTRSTTVLAFSLANMACGKASSAVYTVPVPSGLVASVGDFALTRARIDSVDAIGVWGTYADMTDSSVQVRIRIATRAREGPADRRMTNAWNDALRQAVPGAGRMVSASIASDTVWHVPLPVAVRLGRGHVGTGAEVLVGVVLVDEDILQFFAPVVWDSTARDGRVWHFAERFTEAFVSARDQLNRVKAPVPGR